MLNPALRRMSALAAGGVLAAAALTGCAITQSAGPSGSEDSLKIAFLTASSANTWLAASLDAMQEEAEAEGVEIVEFDGKFEPGLQPRQIQDVIAAGTYDGIILAAIDGTGAIPGIEDALDAGLEVVILNQVVGDALDTADPQVEGVAASVLAPPQATGERLGELALSACEGTDPCRVVYMYGLRGTPYDTAVRTGFDSVIAQHPAIEVIAEGEGGFLGTDEPLKATQDILQAHPGFEVFVGTGDQHVRGALLAFQDAGVDSVKTIGVGASEPAIAAIADGTWFADVAGAPKDEGRVAFAAILAAIRDGEHLGGIDVTTELPDGGLITSENVADFRAQWAG
ncbi:sugar ABC transporter substrate-binding protein [Agromyces aerolatus]|uniref:sugar ABC transporter substrate-binding protein n=1 Tax=Agromyces sp. LY-1074 TaxID=3074080 RepID=UPI002860DBE7|nr:MULTISPECIES: sugar ABC transporter substrate-binding protein [unclassified Agromyces]MDR5699327.1 sugar ABC transporter substrate-binding protein [Agromyces sp. LY-1074]MDR5705623.1 sugar ABC transporter substrate-binding protein [Agromyces sp. LY-1358]